MGHIYTYFRDTWLEFLIPCDLWHFFIFVICERTINRELWLHCFIHCEWWLSVRESRELWSQHYSWHVIQVIIREIPWCGWNFIRDLHRPREPPLGDKNIFLSATPHWSNPIISTEYSQCNVQDNFRFLREAPKYLSYLVISFSYFDLKSLI